ncbi:hypothetical protein [Patulibacter americanus]|uniref:hypothetical protein n=1 Tax=Patulibacter americanus TaxID=588672 RepID=UPI0003B53E00|nr:hypothetical protein [Patulibacter americanus]
MPDPLSPPAALRRAPAPPDAVHLTSALGELLPLVARARAPDDGPADPWPALRDSVVDLVELTAATHVLGIHARLSVGVGLGGLPGSRVRARTAAAAVVVRHATVLRAAGADPDDWRPEALLAAADATGRGAARGARPLEALPRLVAERVAAALAHQGGRPRDAVPDVARGLGYALGLFVLVDGADAPVTGGAVADGPVAGVPEGPPG